VAVIPAESVAPSGTLSIWMRTGMRRTRRTQVKIRLTVAIPCPLGCALETLITRDAIAVALPISRQSRGVPQAVRQHWPSKPFGLPRRPPLKQPGAGSKHGSILSGNFLLRRVSSQWKSTAVPLEFAEDVVDGRAWRKFIARQIAPRAAGAKIEDRIHRRARIGLAWTDKGPSNSQRRRVICPGLKESRKCLTHIPQVDLNRPRTFPSQ
jgi:hypothetical protein